MDRINHVKIVTPEPEAVDRFLREVLDVPEGWVIPGAQPARAHLVALDMHGACPLHRRSFSPVYVQQLMAMNGGVLPDDDSLDDVDEADFELCLDLEGHS